ncbi:FAD-dependent oxidoreductase [Halomarina rubra]|uniref:FAD-dependent oxidoreductase n=1 Tax=Halomarina rubra TaxID=2071873 RepID=A0ABD6AR29_9EURY|nr:FAD-dependent oxidoreductase [Halomarina rubra]
MTDFGRADDRGGSLWLEPPDEEPAPTLETDVRTQTTVVGGGVAGVTTALLLAERGRDVVLLERDRIGHGVTGHSTAKVTAQHGLVYDALERRHGVETTRQYADANRRAVEFVANRVEAHGIECGFRRLPAVTYTDSVAEVGSVRDEVAAATRAGLPATAADDVPFRDAVAGVRVDDQALFDPHAYLLGLTRAVVDAGGEVFERSRVTDVETGTRCRVTANGNTVVSDDVVLATHFPLLDRVGAFLRQYPKQSYVLALETDDPPPEAMYYRATDPYFSVRPARVDGESLTLVGGQNHKTGHGAPTAERYAALEAEAREQFDVQAIPYRWSTQDYASADGLPYVGGLAPFWPKLYVATGFGGWGMSNGTAAGVLLADLLTGRSNRNRDAFEPLRATLRASAPKLATENAAVATTFVRDWVQGLSGGDPDLPAPGEATVGRHGRAVLGRYRDETGTVHVVDGVCPHMGCLLRWNDGERTWDCPCHGSRFRLDGRVVDGPATEDLSYESFTPDGDALR